MSDVPVEERSDELDHKLAVFPQRVGDDVRHIFLLLVATIIGGVLAVSSMFVYLARIAESSREQSRENQKVLTLQIPGLERQIRDREATIEQLGARNAATEYMLNKQAIPAIVYMIGQIEELGGRPPRVLLEPSEPPFTPPKQDP